MSAIWKIDPALAGPPVSPEARQASSKALRDRLNATLARIGYAIELDAALGRERRAALEWCRENDNPHWNGATSNPFLPEQVQP